MVFRQTFQAFPRSVVPAIPTILATHHRHLIVFIVTPLSEVRGCEAFVQRYITRNDQLTRFWTLFT